MIVMVEEGRLGNQIFQYAALRDFCRPNERLLLLGFDQLRETFNGLDATFRHIASNPLKHLTTLNYELVESVTRLLPLTGMLTESPTAKAQRDRSRITISRPAWFQTNAYVNSVAVNRLEIRSVHVEEAQDLLTNLGLSGAHTAFVHIRAGDYRQWPSIEAPAILSPDWYAAQVARLREADPAIAVIGIGDEPEYVDEVMSTIPHSFTAQATYTTEFALMSMCASGILSASSFAYWGAIFARRSSPNGLFIAPKYWAGHAAQAWYPPNIETSSFVYADVTA